MVVYWRRGWRKGQLGGSEEHGPPHGQGDSHAQGKHTDWSLTFG